MYLATGIYSGLSSSNADVQQMCSFCYCIATSVAAIARYEYQQNRHVCGGVLHDWKVTTTVATTTKKKTLIEPFSMWAIVLRS